MNQRRRLECLTRRLRGHFRDGQFAEFVVNERQQRLGGLGDNFEPRLDGQFFESARRCGTPGREIPRIDMIHHQVVLRVVFVNCNVGVFWLRKNDILWPYIA